DRERPRLQPAAGDAHQSARRAQPAQMVIVLAHPLHGIAWQSVSTRQSADATVLQSAQSALGGSPDRTVRFDTQLIDSALTQSICRGVPRPKLTVCDIRDAAVVDPQPQAVCRPVARNR